MNMRFILLGIGILLQWLIPYQVNGKQIIPYDKITLTLNIYPDYEVNFQLYNQQAEPAKTIMSFGGFSVDWGDGKRDSTNNHVYTQEGTFKVTIQAKKLTFFEIKCNVLTSLDVSQCKSLEYLYCESKSLTMLYIGECQQLNELYCYGNLTGLNITQCRNLSILDCSNNQLSHLDVTHCSELIYLKCYGNDLTTLDITKSFKLKYLNCSNNQLNSLNTNNCTNLLGIFCYSNRLTNLNLAMNTKLQLLDCCNNQLHSLDIGTCNQLIKISCYNNQFDNNALSVICQDLPTVLQKGLMLNPVIEVSYLSKGNIHLAESKGWQVKFNKN